MVSSSGLRGLLKKIPGVRSAYRYGRFLLPYLSETVSLARLWRRSHRHVDWNPESNLIISLTSFPARIDHAWITIESLFQQNFRPWKVVLVLSDEEFPTRELPKSILRQQAGGRKISFSTHSL
jgi:hypothetical protein